MARTTRIELEPDILEGQTKWERILRRFQRIAPRIPFARYALAMGYAMRDPAVDSAKKWIIASALMYVISPIDLIPDFIPIMGKLDDVTVLMAAYKRVQEVVTDEHFARADARLRHYRDG